MKISLFVALVLILSGCSSSNKRVQNLEREVDPSSECYGPPPMWQRLARIEKFHGIRWNDANFAEAIEFEKKNVACRKNLKD